MDSDVIKVAIRDLRNNIYPVDRSPSGSVPRSELLELIRKIDDFLRILEKSL